MRYDAGPVLQTAFYSTISNSTIQCLSMLCVSDTVSGPLTVPEEQFASIKMFLIIKKVFNNTILRLKVDFNKTN